MPVLVQWTMKTAIICRDEWTHTPRFERAHLEANYWNQYTQFVVVCLCFDLSRLIWRSVTPVLQAFCARLTWWIASRQYLRHDAILPPAAAADAPGRASQLHRSLPRRVVGNFPPAVRRDAKQTRRWGAGTTSAIVGFNFVGVMKRRALSRPIGGPSYSSANPLVLYALRTSWNIFIPVKRRPISSTLNDWLYTPTDSTEGKLMLQFYAQFWIICYFL